MITLEYNCIFALLIFHLHKMGIEAHQQSAVMKTDAGTCASLFVSLLTTSSGLSNHFLLYTPIDLAYAHYTSLLCFAILLCVTLHLR